MLHHLFQIWNTFWSTRFQLKNEIYYYVVLYIKVVSVKRTLTVMFLYAKILKINTVCSLKNQTIGGFSKYFLKNK